MAVAYPHQTHTVQYISMELSNINLIHVINESMAEKSF